MEAICTTSSYMTMQLGSTEYVLLCALPDSGRVFLTFDVIILA